jgi:olfactory receptor
MVWLMAKAFDRYVAICKPLHYLTIMSPWVCLWFLVTSCITGLIHSLVQLAFVVDLPFCGPNVFDSFYCDLLWLLRLACTNTQELEFMVTVNSGLISVGSFVLLVISYIFILLTGQKHSSGGSLKAFSTLSAHVTVVIWCFSIPGLLPHHIWINILLFLMHSSLLFWMQSSTHLGKSHEIGNEKTV